VTALIKSDTAAPAGLAALARRDRRTPYAMGYPKEWAGLASDVPGATALWQWEAQAPWSFAKQAAPVNGDVLADVFAGDPDNVGYGTGDITLPSVAQTLVYTEGGFKFATFTNTVLGGMGVRAPVALSAAMKTHPTDATKNDLWLVWIWVKLPEQAQWPTVDGSTPGIVEMAEFSTTQPSAFGIKMTYSNTSGPQLWGLRRYGNAPNFDPQLAIPTADIPFGKTVLIGFYRKGAAAGDVGFFMKSVAKGEKLVTSTTNNASTSDYSAAPIKWGIAGSGLGSPSHTASSTSNDLRSHIFKAGGAEALGLTGRDPLAVLRSEWALQLQRGVYGLNN